MKREWVLAARQLSATAWYGIALGIVSVYTAYFTFWTVLIALTHLGGLERNFTGVDLRNFVVLMPELALYAIYMLDALLILALGLLAMRSPWAVPVFAAGLGLDVLSWIAFSQSPYYENSRQIFLISFGLLGLWAMLQWRAMAKRRSV